MDKDNPTQVGRALTQLGIELIPAYSPEARGRSEAHRRRRQHPCDTKGMTLQIPEDRHRHHDVKAKVRVHEYPDATLAIFHGPRRDLQ